MKQMVEALEGFYEYGYDRLECYEHITAIKQAIAEAEKQQHEESVRLQCTHCGTVYADGVPPQVPEKQEPVGWIDSKGFMACVKTDESCKPLYTTPQQRTWVDLTDDEMLMIYGQQHEGKKYSLGRMVQQAIKEKNL